MIDSSLDSPGARAADVEQTTPDPHAPQPKSRFRWMNSTVLGIGLASLFSDWSHEVATTVLPALLATMGVAAAWVGLIEGVSDGISSFAKLASGHLTDRLPRRKPVLVLGYVATMVGTACFGLATSAWHVLLARVGAWLGRGVRSPVKKAILAASVTRESYGRAFGFERMMDTVGAIAGPATAFILLHSLGLELRSVFLWTLLPGAVAVGLIVFAVREKARLRVSRVSFRDGIRRLPSTYRRFLVAVGIFGAGDFSHTLLILLATQKLTPAFGATAAASAAVALYVAHNIAYAAFAFAAGWLADHFPRRRVLAFGYALAALMALLLIFLPPSLSVLAVVFVVGGLFVAIEETVEDSLCAELVPDEQHGMAFGVLATINGVGDFLSSVVVGALWTAFGTPVAFSYSFVLFVAGSVLVLGARSATAGRQ